MTAPLIGNSSGVADPQRTALLVPATVKTVGPPITVLIDGDDDPGGRINAVGGKYYKPTVGDRVYVARQSSQAVIAALGGNYTGYPTPTGSGDVATLGWVQAQNYLSGNPAYDQFRTGALTVSASSGFGSISYASGFPSGTAAVVATVTSGTSAFVCQVVSVGANGFSVNVYTQSGAAYSGSFGLHYFAVGQ